MMTARELVATRVADLVKCEPRVIMQLADLGIGPRYLDWTIASACAELGVNVDRAVSRLSPFVAG
jgi:hypothetical protein